MFEKERPIDLENFLPTSLNLVTNTNPSLNNKFNRQFRDEFEEFIRQDPRTLLSFTDIGKSKYVPTDYQGTPIQEFFRGVCVLITGGTGFLGKMLTEKLIRCVPHIERVYLLIRAKRGKTAEERLQELLEDQVFLRMKTEVPDYHSKLIVVNGDINEPGLGLIGENRQLLIESIHVVFHSAANVRFLEPLKDVFLSNVLGTKRLLDLTKEMKKLKSFVHISTAYSQCVRRVIEERVYKVNISYKEVLDFISDKSVEEVEKHSPRITQGWPNGYTFSKAVCEDMLAEETEGMPVCIVRPSVVIPSYMEPIKGWTDNVNGSVGVMAGYSLGVIHCFHADLEISLDQVPVDYVTNCCIAAACMVKGSNSQSGVPVFNMVGSTLKPSTFGRNRKLANGLVDKFPYNHAIWYPFTLVTRSALLFNVYFYLLHSLPALFFDAITKIRGGKILLSRVYRKFHTLSFKQSFFSKRHWEFITDNVMEMWKALDPKDKEIFYFDVRDIDELKMIVKMKLGIRQFIIKEKVEDIPTAEKRHKWLYWTHIFSQVVLGICTLKLMATIARMLPF